MSGDTKRPSSDDLRPGAPQGRTDAAGAPAVFDAQSAVGQAGRKSLVREYAEAIIVAMLLAFAIRVFVVQARSIATIMASAYSRTSDFLPARPTADCASNTAGAPAASVRPCGATGLRSSDGGRFVSPLILHRLSRWQERPLAALPRSPPISCASFLPSASRGACVSA